MATNKRLIKSNDEGGGASFNTVLYTGNGNANGPILDVGFQPDFMWIKSRETIKTHRLHDIIRGRDKTLNSDTTDAESGVTNYVDFRYSDTQARITNDSNGWNELNIDYVAWNWKAGGAAVTNTDGTITSQVSANVEAGFSISTFTTPLTNNFSVGHGLNSAPELVFLKGRSIGSSWTTYSSEIGADKYLFLNSTNAQTTSSFPFNNTAPTSSVLNLGSSTVWYGTNQDWVAYSFHSVPGFSKFGSYTGTGGVLSEQTLGFEPAFIMFKRTDSTGDWFIYDNKRDTTDPRTVGLYANLSAAEYNTSGSPGYADINFLSNGFSMNASYVGINGSGGTFIYMAFANQF